MRLFCPCCGRTRQFNPEVVGLAPRVCPCCVFTMEQNIDPGHKVPRPLQVEGALKPFGLTFVAN